MEGEDGWVAVNGVVVKRAQWKGRANCVKGERGGKKGGRDQRQGLYSEQTMNEAVKNDSYEVKGCIDAPQIVQKKKKSTAPRWEASEGAVVDPRGRQGSNGQGR